MSKDVIQIDGKDVVVREDTAKAYRGVNWALISIAAFVAIIVILFAAFFLMSPVSNPSDPPSQRPAGNNP